MKRHARKDRETRSICYTLRPEETLDILVENRKAAIRLRFPQNVKVRKVKRD